MAYKIKTTVTTINKRRAFNYIACRWATKKWECWTDTLIKIEVSLGRLQNWNYQKKPSKLKLWFVTLPQYNNKLLYFHIVEANVNCFVFIISAASKIELQAELYLRDYVTTL